MNDFTNLLCSIVSYDHLPDDVPEDWVTKTLIDRGGIGYWDTNNEARGFYRASPIGEIDRYGISNAYSFETATHSFDVTRSDGARYIKANATGTAIKPYFDSVIAVLDICDRAIQANVRAQIYGRIIRGGGKLKDRLESALDALETGRPQVINDDIFDAMVETSEELMVPFTADRVQAVRAQIWADAIKRCGSVAANQYRQERTQSAEVEANVAESIDMVYIMITQFNADCKRQNITGKDGKIIQMKFAGYIDRYDTAEDEQNGVEQHEEVQE